MKSHDEARNCQCGALIEEVDSGNGFTYWAHVKRMRIEFDHAAVPQPTALSMPEWDGRS